MILNEESINVSSYTLQPAERTYIELLLDKLCRIHCKIAEYGIDRECKKEANGDITLKGLSMANCQDYNGLSRNQGSEWREGSFQFRCNEGGMKKIIGCVTSSGMLIPVGGVKLILFKENGVDIQCEREANGFVTLRKLFKGSCQDYAGRSRTQGSEWLEGSTKFRCVQGVKTAVGCVAAPGTIIEAGKVKSVNGYEIECNLDKNGHTTMKTTPSSSNLAKCVDFDGRIKFEGSEWTSGLFHFRCDAVDGLILAGCNASGTFIPNGKVKSVDGIDVKCERNAKDIVSLTTVGASKCKDGEGRMHAQDSEWRYGSFQFGCKADTAVLVGCIAKTGIFIPNGKVKSVGGQDMKCETKVKGHQILNVLSSSTDVKCKDHTGQRRRHLENWYEFLAHKACRQDGRVNFLGCRRCCTKEFDLNDKEDKNSQREQPTVNNRLEPSALRGQPNSQAHPKITRRMVANFAIAHRWLETFRDQGDQLTEKPRERRPQHVNRQAVVCRTEEDPLMSCPILANRIDYDPMIIWHILQETGKQCLM
ncbi:hypothetical protein KIN20_002059 [Parelaphostrongylus tenuis]|uniref:Abnormal cell migration protein 18-like fibronectin type I domain-containing protein n=1 Tax=Parelaphostrongylus tenuis TaxID=148309 RepID=A0AAD5MN10_PARTN|nr:hypothetical protein KIN20_002059 [Parelaphostrongylus tenuis]